MSAIHIQHKHKPSFYYGTDRWVLGCEHARRFADAREAIAFCFENNVVYAQVRVSFGPRDVDVVIPITRQMPVAFTSPEAVVG